MERSAILRLVMALLIAISGGIHLRLYRQAYRDISIYRILGIDLSRSFVLSVAAAALVAVALVASAITGRFATTSVLAGVAYAIGAIGAYALSRTVGLLGFEEDRWIAEAVWAQGVQAATVALGVLAIWATRETFASAHRRSGVVPSSTHS